MPRTPVIVLLACGSLAVMLSVLGRRDLCDLRGAQVLPQLKEKWDLDDKTGSLLTIMVNIGFLVGALVRPPA